VPREEWCSLVAEQPVAVATAELKVLSVDLLLTCDDVSGSSLSLTVTTAQFQHSAGQAIITSSSVALTQLKYHRHHHDNGMVLHHNVMILTCNTCTCGNQGDMFNAADCINSHLPIMSTIIIIVIINFTSDFHR